MRVEFWHNTDRFVFIPTIEIVFDDLSDAYVIVVSFFNFELQIYID